MLASSAGSEKQQNFLDAFAKTVERACDCANLIVGARARPLLVCSGGLLGSALPFLAGAASGERPGRVPDVQHEASFPIARARQRAYGSSEPIVGSPRKGPRRT